MRRLTMKSRFDRRPLLAVALRRALGRLEDRALASSWAWDAALSHRVDSLLVLIEGAGA